MTDVAPLSSSDFDAWAPLWRGYQSFYRTEIPDDTSRQTFARLTQGVEPMGAFLARDADRAIGLVHWINHRSCWTSGDYCYLQDLFVADDVRGGGVGRKLIDAVVAVARQRQCSRVYWLTEATNARAMLLYDQVAAKSGFVQYVKRL